MAKPFVKWAGGKGKLLNTLEQYLPVDFDEQPAVTYIEPFVGGGAMLFHMLEAHPNINRVIINDINPQLFSCYLIIRDNPQALIASLQDLQNQYYEIGDQEGRQAFFMEIRNEYNLGRFPVNDGAPADDIQLASYFIFLNRTCFNGLYRENGHGFFNVPFGRYVNPMICNAGVLLQAHDALQGVEILNGDYDGVMEHVNWAETNFFYFDPPYRPLPGTQNFKDYTQWPFNDAEQEALRNLCNLIHEHGARFMLSNSDSGTYFDEIYQGYNIERIYAPRVINAFAARRVPQTEVLIRNY